MTLHPDSAGEVTPSKLRILLVIYAYPPVLGGSEIEAQRVAAALIQRGHEVQVLCTGGPEMPQVRNWVDPAGVPVSILTRRSKGLWKDRIFALRVAWRIWSGRREYDVVYFLMQGLHLASGLPAAHLAGKPVVAKISGSGIIPVMQGTRIGRLELGWLRRWRVPVMLLNSGMFEEASRAGLSLEQLVWMPNPVDPAEFRPPKPGEAAAWRQQHGIAKAGQVGIYVGRLSHEKGLPGLIRGFAEAAAELPDALLLLVGDGPMRTELETMVRNLGPVRDQIRFIGRVPVEEVPNWLRASDVFALMSPNEGFPCALVEAMAVGLPSVVSDIPANIQLIDHELHGLTARFDDETAIGAAFLRLFCNPLLLEQTGTASRKRVLENYSVQKVIVRYEAMFRDAIASANPHVERVGIDPVR
jgi:glycosyltransferase involved in cell wall biosynthesis